MPHLRGPDLAGGWAADRASPAEHDPLGAAWCAGKQRDPDRVAWPPFRVPEHAGYPDGCRQPPGADPKRPQVLREPPGRVVRKPAHVGDPRPAARYGHEMF